MKKLVFIFVLLLVIKSVFCNEALSPRIANYIMHISLDNDKKMLDGATTLNWKNPSPTDTVRTLQFHLYYNAFRNTESTFNKERADGNSFMGRIDVKSDPWGWSEIMEMQDEAGNDLSANMKYIQPDDDNIGDRTVLEVALTKPVLPNQSTTVNFKWKAKIPNKAARTGHHKDFYFFAQWFPKVGVYEPAGMRYAEKGAWNCHQYHSSGEYYSDFGVYDVYLKVSENFVIGSSGELKSKVKDGEFNVWNFYVEDVIDFAWATSAQFKIAERKWKDVDIKLLYYPGKEAFVERYFTNITNAFSYMDEYVGAYPYPTFTIIDAPIYGIFSGAMEYPTLMTCISASFLPKGLKFTEALTAHEFIHQYFMQMVATHEVEEPWMDEGFTTYYEMRVMDEFEGKNTSAVDFLGVKMGSSEFNRAEYLSEDNPKIAEGNRRSWHYEHGGYGTIAYNKTGMWLKTLEGLIGTDVMDEVMQTYFERWKFKHPKGQDFIDVVNEIVPQFHQEKYGDDMNWFFEQVLYSSDVCDYKVASISVNEIVPKAGVYDINKSAIIPEEEDEKVFVSKVVINRTEGLKLPVEIEVFFDDDSSTLEFWDGKDRSVDFKYTGTKKVVAANIDPERKIDLDINFLNNSHSIEHQHIGVRKYVAQFISLLQQVMQVITVFIYAKALATFNNALHCKLCICIVSCISIKQLFTKYSSTYTFCTRKFRRF